MDNIGSSIRSIRKAKKITITNLAKMANISKSLISQIERGEVSPSLLTLRKIASALDIPIVNFFNYDEKNEICEDDYIVRKSNRKKLCIPGSNAIYHLLSPNVQRKIEFLLIEVLPQKGEEPVQFKHAGEECTFVLEGELYLTLGDKEFHLQEGDSIYFDSGIPHNIENRSNKKALIVTAITPPNF